MLLAQPNKEKLREALKDANFNQKFEVGVNLMHDRVYSEALYVWELLLEEDPNNANLNYKAGLCKIRLNKENESLPYFEKAQHAVSKNYNPFAPTERHAPPELLYYLAQSSHVHGMIDTALYQYNFFLENVKHRHAKYDLAALGKIQCENALRLMANPKNYKIHNIGDIVNTPAPEYSPVITIDGSALFFTSKRLRPDSTNKRYINIENGQYYEDIYVSYRSKDGDWADPEYLRFCSVRQNNASISASPDGQKVLVYEDVQNGDIYYSVMEDTAFGDLQPFPIEELNTNHFEPHATVSPDENYIYFSSDRPGGMGGLDIYRLKKLPDGSWSKAYNLGPPINSKYDEDSPFLGADNRTLYFSSNGKRSMGGYDIFVSRADEDEKWSEPENMGYPLNSVDDDIYYTTTADGLVGFYASDKLEGKGDKDIYIVETEASYIRNVAIFTGFIVTADHSMIPNGINIFVTDLTDKSKPKQYSPRRRDGGYVLTLKPCHTYEIDYQFEGESFYHTKLYVPCNSSYQEIKHELLLDMVNLEASVLIDNLPIAHKRWEFENTEQFDQLEGKQVKIYEGDQLMTEEFINRYGQFPYKELDPNKTHLMKIEEQDFDFCEKLVLNLIDSANNVLDTYTFNSECNSNPTVSEFSTILTTPIFQYNFGYNKEEFNTKNEDLKEYVRGVKQLLDAGKDVTIYVTASASKVPTKKFKNNSDLAKKRLETGKTIMTKLLKSNRIDMSRVTFVDDEILVGGPDYNNDAVENAQVYERYQFIKFEVRF